MSDWLAPWLAQRARRLAAWTRRTRPLLTDAECAQVCAVVRQIAWQARRVEERPEDARSALREAEAAWRVALGVRSQVEERRSKRSAWRRLLRALR